MNRLIFGICLIILSQTMVFCKTPAEPGKALVEIQTRYGNIKVELHDETPLHRDNFLKLASEGFYNDLLFHRVIAGFMIQGGDPTSRGAARGAQLGAGDPGYTIEAEIVHPQLFHQKGALAAARQGDQVNPTKRSSGSQFFIVQGKIFTHDELTNLEGAINNRRYQQLMMSLMEPHRQRFQQLQQAGDQAGFNALLQQVSEAATAEAAQQPPFKFSEAQREAYTTVGGTPHLDGDYTVFGQVVEGLDVIDRIAATKTGSNDRPAEDIEMKVKVIRGR